MESEDKDVIETEMDEALASAMEDPAKANFFYDTFLNADLFFPVQKDGTKSGSWSEMSPQDRFHPLFLSFANGKAIPVFDGLARLKRWAESKKLDFARVKAHKFIGAIDPTVYLVLNLGNQWNYTFTPEVLEQIRTAMRKVTPS